MTLPDGKLRMCVISMSFKTRRLAACEKLGIPQFSVFISHVIKTKNRNRSINKLKNLGYDRCLCV